MFKGDIAFMESIYNLSALLTGVYAAFMAVFLYLKNRASSVNRSYSCFLVSVTWWSLALFVCQLSQDRDVALFWNRLLHVGATLIPLAFLIYTLIYLGQFNAKRNIVRAGVFFAAAISVIDMFTPLVIKGMAPKWYFHLWPEPGILYPLFLLFFFSYFGYAMLLLVMAYRKAESFRRTQLKYILVAIVLASTGGSTNYFLFYDIHIHPIANWFCVLYSFIISYAIIRYRLMEIDTVIHRTALWLLTLILAVLPIAVIVVFIRDWLFALGRVKLLGFMSVTLLFFIWYYNKLKPKIDHFFRRRKYDYYHILGEIAQKVGSELDIKDVATRLLRELKEVMYIRNGLILVQQPEQLDYSQVGAIGYEHLLAVEKKHSLQLIHQSSLSLWLQKRQEVLEREQIEIDPKFSSIKEEAIDFFQINSLELLIPVIMENRVNALIGLGKKENLQAYTLKDIEILGQMGRQAGVTFDNALHHEDIVEKERLDEELRLAKEIQDALLPKETPKLTNLVVEGLMHPAKEIGGDYYDFIPLPYEDSLGIAIGDVSGKGVAAGLLMAMAKTAIHTLVKEDASPKSVLLKTNAILFQHIGGQKFMTLLYFKYNPGQRNLTYSSAGHEHILIYHAKTDEVEVIMSGGFMLGMLLDIEDYLEERSLNLEPADKVLLYTDGVTEAQNNLNERLGLEGLKEIFKRYCDRPAPELIQAIKGEVYSFMGDKPQFDDITLVAMEAK